MSIQWTLIAGVMYVELAATVILLIPFISAKRWHSIFKSRFFCSIGNMSHIYFKIFLAILALCFIDAIREMRKYSGELAVQTQGDHSFHLDAQTQAHMKLFRAQRNFYISGFSLFLWIVLQRLATLISALAISGAQCEAAMKQAASASATASHLLEQEQQQSKDKTEIENLKATNTMNEIKEMKELVKKMEAEKEAALRQAKSVSQEYDRLLEEHNSMEKKLKVIQGVQESKKDD